MAYSRLYPADRHGGGRFGTGGHVPSHRGLERRVLLSAVEAAATDDCGCGAYAGDLDPKFGQGGTVVTGFPTSRLDRAAAVVVAGSRVVVAGYRRGTSFQESPALARYDVSGRADRAFGAGGRLLVDPLDFGGSGFRLFAAVQQPGGKLVAAIADENGYVSLVRFNPDGTPDRSFGTLGVSTTPATLDPFGDETISLRTAPTIVHRSVESGGQAESSGIRRHRRLRYAVRPTGSCRALP